MPSQPPRPFEIDPRTSGFKREDATVCVPIDRYPIAVRVAILLWTTVGSAVEREEPAVRLKCKQKGGRLSLVRIGTYYWQMK